MRREMKAFGIGAALAILFFSSTATAARIEVGRDGAVTVEAPAPIQFATVTVLADVLVLPIAGSGLEVCYVDREPARTVFMLCRPAGGAGAPSGRVAIIERCAPLDTTGCVNAPCHIITTEPAMYAACNGNLTLESLCAVVGVIPETWGAVRDLYR